MQDPYPVYQAFRRHRAVWWDAYDMWVFPRFDDVSAIFRDRRFGRQILHRATREELGWDPVPEHLEPFHAFEAHSLLEKEPPEHTRLRALVNRAFVSRQIEALRPGIETLARDLARDLAEGDDLIERYCTPIPVTVITRILGVPEEMAPQLLDWSHRMVAMYQARRDRAVEDDAVAATEAFVDFMQTLIAQRRRNPGEDLLSVLIAAEAAGDRLSADELVATAILLLNAGHEATVHAIGNGIRSLVLSGVDFSAVPSETAVEEVLRHDPPLHLFTRYVLEDLEWDGLALRKGQEVGLLIGSANRDERAMSDPQRFDPYRPRAPHVSLGGGIHFCVGAPLARLEVEIALRVLFETLGPRPDVSVGAYADTYHFHGLTGITLKGRADV